MSQINIVAQDKIIARLKVCADPVAIWLCVAFCLPFGAVGAASPLRYHGPCWGRYKMQQPQSFYGVPIAKVEVAERWRNENNIRISESRFAHPIIDIIWVISVSCEWGA